MCRSLASEPIGEFYPFCLDSHRARDLANTGEANFENGDVLVGAFTGGCTPERISPGDLGP